MTDLGYVAVALSLPIAVYAVVASVVGARRRIPELIVSGQNAVLAVAGLLLLSSGILVRAFLTHEFQVEYVAQNSSMAMPRYLLVTALWGGQDGSLLFWSMLLALYAAAVVIVNRGKRVQLMAYATAVMMVIAVFFIGLVVFIANPFHRLDFVPADGLGLNPLLWHPAMSFHPPMLYLGFVGFTVPFAFAMAALLTKQVGSEWLRVSRRWTLTAWLFLSIGIMLGGRWAYDVLGWGGYWGWDPVENASLLPWLTGTAFIHSVMVQERKGMLKVWNMVLIIVTFGLMLLGTFITRSGVISSVHAFAQSGIGPPFLAFLAIVILGALLLFFDRLSILRSDRQIDTLVSREASFLFQNWLFLGATFAVFWGTIFPMISELVTGNQITVGAPFFQRVSGPIFAGVLLLMGVIPLIGWGGASTEKLVRNLVRALIVTGLLMAGLVVLGVRSPVALIGFGLSLFAALTTLADFIRGARARRKTAGENFLTALVTLLRRSRRRYGGYLVHLAVVLMAVGIVGSTVYKVDRTFSLRRGESASIGPYGLRYDALAQNESGDKVITTAHVTVSQNGRQVEALTPRRDFYVKQQQPMTIPAIRSTSTEDLYVILASWEDGGQTVSLKAWINPLVTWIWIGALLFVGGTLVAAWPEPARRPAFSRRRSSRSPQPRKV